MKIRQNMDTKVGGGLILRFSDGVHERWRRGSLALLLGWVNGVEGGMNRCEASFFRRGEVARSSSS